MYWLLNITDPSFNDNTEKFMKRGYVTLLM